MNRKELIALLDEVQGACFPVHRGQRSCDCGQFLKIV